MLSILKYKELDEMIKDLQLNFNYSIEDIIHDIVNLKLDKEND